MLNTVTVTWNEQDIGEGALAGSVTFQLSAVAADQADGIDIHPAPAKTYFFVSGTGSSGPLVANDNAGLLPAGGYYKVTVAISGQQPYTFSTLINYSAGASQTLAQLYANQAVPAAQYSQYLPLTTGAPTAGEVPVFTGDGYATTPGAGGGGGSGTVSSVNDVDPDGSGNVTLAASDVGAASTGALASEATTRASADTALSTAISNEATTRGSADTALAAAIVAAQTAAQNASIPITGGTATGPVLATAIGATGLTGAPLGTRIIGANTGYGPPSSSMTVNALDSALDAFGNIWVAASAGVASAVPWMQLIPSPPEYFYPERYGALGNVYAVNDAVVSLSTPTIVNSASNGFAKAVAGMNVVLNQGAAGANVVPLFTTVASVQNAGQATLSAAATSACTGNPMLVGTADDTAMQACWAAVNAYAFANGRAKMICAKSYGFAGAPVLGSTSGPFYGNSLLPIPTPDTTGAGAKYTVGIRMNTPGDSTAYWESKTGQLNGSGFVIMSAAPAPNGTWGKPSVIGGPTVNSWSGGSLTGGFGNCRLHLEDVAILAPYNPGWLGFDARFLAVCTGTTYGAQSFAVGVLGGGNGPTITVPSGSWNFNGAGGYFPAVNGNDKSRFDSVTVEGFADGIWIGDHVAIPNLTVISSANALLVNLTDGSFSGKVHGSWIGYFSAEAQSGSVILVSGSKATNYPLVIGLLDSENSSTPTTVTDTGILTGQINWYDITATVPKLGGSTGLKITNDVLKPGWWAGAPAVPTSGSPTTQATMPWRDATVYMTNGDGAISAVATTVGGVTTTLPGVSTSTPGAVISFRVPNVAGITVTATYTHTSTNPTWVWELD